MSFQQHHTGRCDVQAQSKHGGEQNHGREGRKVKCFGGIQRDHDDQEGQQNVEGEKEIEHHRR